MRKIQSILFSNKVTLLALLLFAGAMAYATFMENDYGTPAARQSIYEAWWFELLMIILTINFFGNIFRYRLLRKEKLAIFLFHVAFIVILVGAFVTRYTGQEGLVRIREGQKTDHMLSEKRYLSIDITGGSEAYSFRKSLGLTRFNQPDENINYENDKLIVSTGRFIPNAVQALVDGEEQEEVLELISSVNQVRQQYFLESGGSRYINNHQITFNNPQEGAINITGNSNHYEIESPEEFNYLIMASQQSGRLSTDVKDTLRLRALYQSLHLNFVVSQAHTGKRLDWTSTDDKELQKQATDLLFMTLSTDTETRRVILPSVNGVYSPQQDIQMADYNIKMSYGPRLVPLPFSLYLEDFQLERYPGSSSPSSYASEVVVLDDGKELPVRISMNNVLDYEGYRFFQASYDTDELGTVLSVNRDFWGTQLTYLGYFLMSLGMILTFFGKQSRFRQVSDKLKKLNKQVVTAVVSLLILVSPTLANDNEENNNPNTSLFIEAGHAEKFGRLMVQDMDGRIKPINTLSSEFLRKLTRKNSYKLQRGDQEFTMNPDQVFLSIHEDPVAWQNIPLIKVDRRKGAEILDFLMINDRELLSFRDLVSDEGQYRLQETVELARRKKPAEQSELDKEVIKVDERFNILFQALTGNFLKIFPEPQSPENNWHSSNFFNTNFSEEDSIFVSNILGLYFKDIKQARLNDEWNAASDKLAYIKTFQESMGGHVMPEFNRVEAELIYNKLNIFNRIFPLYMLMGVALLVMAIFRVFYRNKVLNVLWFTGIGIVGLAFLAQTGNMILRWYAAGYPPWSNGYEMIIFVSWALFLFGFIFMKQSDFIMPMVALFGGTLLFVAFLDWLNPEITNLVPVLKSYWLKIHVAIIVSSYAPLTLSALLGLLSLVFMSFKNDRLNHSIKKLTYINELSMTIGLFLLAIGTFLGGVWANESWGRYWGWDPKETWALISIIVYAIILHMRLVPKLRGEYTFNIASVIGYFSIIMTSFGVNYYLSGLHSYAAGDPLPIPSFVYWVVGMIVAVGLLAYFRKDDFGRASNSTYPKTSSL